MSDKYILIFSINRYIPINNQSTQKTDKHRCGAISCGFIIKRAES